MRFPRSTRPYLPVQRVVAIMDWATRRVLSWNLSNTLDAGFCVGALAEAVDCYGRPEIFNTDQGSQFTSFEFTAVLKKRWRRPLDGRQGHCMDNIFIERLWRSLKYEAVYLHELSDGFAAQSAIAKWLNFYNTTRPLAALAGATPAEAYEKAVPPQLRHKPHRLSAPLPAKPEHKSMINRTLAA